MKHYEILLWDDEDVIGVTKIAYTLQEIEPIVRAHTGQWVVIVIHKEDITHVIQNLLLDAKTG